MKSKFKRLKLRWSRRRNLLASVVTVGLIASSWVPLAKADNIKPLPPILACYLKSYNVFFGWAKYWYCPPTPINPIPQVNASSNIGGGADVGQVIAFSGSFTDGDNDGPYTYIWKFGDGNSISGSVSKAGNIPVNYAYTQAGEFTAILEVTDRSGKKGSRQTTVKIVAISDDTCNPALVTIRSRMPFGMWNIPSTWDKNRLPNANDWVLIQPTHNVILPISPAIAVKGLCIEQNGVLRSAFNSLLTTPSIINLSSGAIRNRGTILSAAGINSGFVGNEYKHATAGSNMLITTSRFVNETTGKITGDGRGGDDIPYTFYQTGSGVIDAIGGNGGNVEIQTDVFINQGVVEGGNGGSGDTFDTWGKFVYGNAYGGKGGAVKINATNLAMSMNSTTGKIKAGNGGLADGIYRWLQLNLLYSWNRRYGWYIMAGWWNSGKMYDVISGIGGNASINLGNISGVIQGSKGQEIRRDLRYPNVIWIEPTTLTMDETTQIKDSENIVIFGGDDWTMDLRKLSPEAIQAEKTITLAVGKNSRIDLRGVTGKIFIAKEKVEIFADEVQLDPGVTLQDLADAPEIIQHPSKILYHVDLSNEEHLIGEPNVTLPVKVSVLNNGPTEDNYTVTVTDSKAWQIVPPPEQVTVEGLRRTDLTFDVILPTVRGAEDELTVTVTSQNDPNVTATTTIRVGVQEQELISPRTGQKADMAIVINNSFNMAGLFQTMANALELFLAAQPVNAPADDEMVNFFNQFSEDNPLTEEAMQEYLAQFKTDPPKLPIIELITFTDNITSRVVTNNFADIIGRIRSLQAQDSGDCSDASIGALAYAVDNLNDNGQIILATASSAEKVLDSDTQLKLQARGIKTHVLLAGSCENSEEADKAFYQNITNVTGGTFNWLPQGIVSEDAIVKTFSEVIIDTIATTTPSGGAVILPPRKYAASGTLRDELGNPIADAIIQIGDKTVTSDATGYWEINGLAENSYTAILNKTGYATVKKNFELGNNQDAVINFKPKSVMNVTVIATPEQPILGEDLNYTVTIKNNGTVTATNVTLQSLLPENIQLVDLTTNKGSCDLSEAHCTLLDLEPKATAMVNLVVNSATEQLLENMVVVSSHEYPQSVKVTETKVKPYLIVTVTDTPDPVEMQHDVQYDFSVTLDEKATNPATDVELAIRLPNGLSLKSVTKGNCDDNQLPMVTCALGTLQPSEQAVVSLSSQLIDANLLALTVEAKVTSPDYLEYLIRERTKLLLPPDAKADIVIAVDTTYSMQEEINAVIKALKDFVAQIDSETTPKVALITFKDEVKLEAYTSDLTYLIRVISKFKAEGGGLCPEASAEALSVAIDHVKNNGQIVLITDAAPYEDSDMSLLQQRIMQNNVKLLALISGDCTNVDMMNDVQ